MFSAARFVVAGAIVALFAGFLLAGVLTQQPSEERTPAVGASATSAVGTGEPASSAEPGQSMSPVATLVMYEAAARLVVDPGPDPTDQDLADAEGAAVRYAEQAVSRAVVQAVIEKLDLDDSPESLLERTSIVTDALLLSISVQDEDPQAAHLIANAYGNELRRRVQDSLITAEVGDVDAAIARNEASIRTLTNRLQALTRKSDKTVRDRTEIISITGQISALQRDIQGLQPHSRAYVRNRLDWLERPSVPEQPVQDEAPEAALPGIVGTVLDQLKGLPEASSHREVVVASQPIPRGTVLEPEMLALRAVPVDLSTDKALTDTADAIGKIAAIEILANQVISPNMFLIAE